MEVTNIKVSIRIFPPDRERYVRNLKKSERVGKRKNSFSVLRLPSLLEGFPPFVYTCFYCGHVNATAIRNWEHVPIAVQLLKDHLGLQERVRLYIDMVSSRWPPEEHYKLKKENLTRLLANAKKEASVYLTTLDRERFPALYIRSRYGTLLWFPTGAIVGMNSKTKEDLEQMKLLAERIKSPPPPSPPRPPSPYPGPCVYVSEP